MLVTGPSAPQSPYLRNGWESRPHTSECPLFHAPWSPLLLTPCPSLPVLSQVCARDAGVAPAVNPSQTSPPPLGSHATTRARLPFPACPCARKGHWWLLTQQSGTSTEPQLATMRGAETTAPGFQGAQSPRETTRQTSHPGEQPQKHGLARGLEEPVPDSQGRREGSRQGLEGTGVCHMAGGGGQWV